MSKKTVAKHSSAVYQFPYCPKCKCNSLTMGDMQYSGNFMISPVKCENKDCNATYEENWKLVNVKEVVYNE